MNIKNTLINFLYDKEYFINIYEDYIYVYNYLDIIDMQDKFIILKLNKFNLRIEGDNLLIKRLSQGEILIKTRVRKVEIIDDLG